MAKCEEVPCLSAYRWFGVRLESEAAITAGVWLRDNNTLGSSSCVLSSCSPALNAVLPQLAAGFV